MEYLDSLVCGGARSAVGRPDGPYVAGATPDPSRNTSAWEAFRPCGAPAAWQAPHLASPACAVAELVAGAARRLLRGDVAL